MLCKMENTACNNFIMTQPEQIRQIPQHRAAQDKLLKRPQDKRQQISDYDPDNSQFMRPLAEPKHIDQKLLPKSTKSVVLTKQQVEKSLREIYDFYVRSYSRPVKQYTSFEGWGEDKIIMQGYFLFCKHFHILKAIFTIERLTILFKKHADYGKFLSFDNFYFMINSMSHEPESKKFFNLVEMGKNLDVETAQELDRQEFYNYLQLGNPERYRQCFTELFGAFDMHEQPQLSKKKYNYRKFSLPELRKKAIPQHKDKKKTEKDLFILKHDKNPHHNVFDQAKSIVVSWDSLRAKSVNNLGKSSEVIEKKLLKADPEVDPYLQEMRPATKKNSRRREEVQPKIRGVLQGNQLQQKINDIESKQQAKNKLLLDRIEKKLAVRSGRKLQM